MQPQEVEHDPSAQPPPLPLVDKHTVACRNCHLVLCQDQFSNRDTEAVHCPACGNEGEEMHEVASAKFSGYVGLVDAEKSWVARLIGCSQHPMGVYAANIDDSDVDEEDEDDEEEV